jgi:methionyl-tRNA formyltransferase
MKIIYCGSGEFGVPCLEAISKSRHQLLHVFTQPSHRAGRGLKTRPTPVAEWASSHSVPHTETADINTADIQKKIAELKPDLMVVIAFGQKLGNDVIHLPVRGSINVHASLLPKYRGAAPINWAIINGETRTGVSIITLAQTMDGGEILEQAQMDILPDDTATSMHDKLSKLAAPLLLATIEKIENGTAVYRPQDISLVTKAPKFKKSHGYIDWSEPAQTLCNKIRGMWAWPGAESNYIARVNDRCERVTIAKCEVVPRTSAKFVAPGVVDENLNVVCGKDALKILMIKPAGSSLMDFKSFCNGRATAPGDLFMKIDNAN